MNEERDGTKWSWTVSRLASEICYSLDDESTLRRRVWLVFAIRCRI